jgi:hypothetical protein
LNGVTGAAQTMNMENVTANTCYEIIDQLVAGTGLYITEVIDCENTGGTLIQTADAKGSNDLSIYPNPASDRVSFLSNGKITDITLYSLVGKQVGNYKNVHSSLDVSHLAAGTYLVKITFPDGSGLTRKLIKQ